MGRERKKLIVLGKRIALFFRLREQVFVIFGCRVKNISFLGLFYVND